MAVEWYNLSMKVCMEMSQGGPRTIVETDQSPRSRSITVVNVQRGY